MKALVLGAGGMLGRALVAAAPREVDASGLARAELDVTDSAAMRARVSREAPDWLINCAAFTHVDAAEDDHRARRVNGEAPALIGAVAAQARARVLHLSTDYVFDGTLGRPYRETDPPNPVGEYGRGKLAGEEALVASGAEWLIVRSQWLYGDGGPSFVATMRERARAGTASRVVNDQRGAPTHTGALAAMIWRLVSADARGMVHATAAGEATWLDVAREVYRALGANAELVTACTTAEYGARAPRPLDGRLDTSRYTTLTGHRPEPWRVSLDRHLATAQKVNPAAL